jgi:hypothetical protein
VQLASGKLGLCGHHSRNISSTNKYARACRARATVEFSVKEWSSTPWRHTRAEMELVERLRRRWSSRVHSGVETEGVEGIAAGVELQGCILGVEVVTQLQQGPAVGDRVVEGRSRISRR